MRRRVSRGLTLMVGVGVAACGGGEAGGTPGNASADAFCREVTPQVDAWLADAGEVGPGARGETVVVGGAAELPAGLNAFVVGDYASRQHQQYVALMPLLRFDEELRLAPWLAESWEMNEEGTEVTFRLRDDVVWHDGEPTDAEDVAFTYARITDPATPFPNPAYWKHYVRGPEGVEILDDRTVRFRMEPHGDPLHAWATVGIMPEHLLGEVPPGELARHPFGTRCPVGNGPFVFREHVPGDRWVFQANPAFPEELGGRPEVDRYVFRIIPEQPTLLTELLTGALDVYVAVAPDQAEVILEDPEVELRAYDWPGYVYVGWNGRRPVLSDSRVRRALSLATDREEVVGAILQGYGRVAHVSPPPFHPAYREKPPGMLAYDPEAARALLREAGWTDRDGDGIRENADGEALSFTIKYHPGNRQRQGIAEIMQSQLRKVGVDARPVSVEWNTLLSQITDPESRDFDGVVMAWTVDFRVDDRDLFHSDAVDGQLAFSGTRNPRIDALIDSLDVTRDRTERQRLWASYQEALSEEQPYTWFYFPQRLDGVRTRLRGAVMDARGEWVTIHRWRLDPATP